MLRIAEKAIDKDGFLLAFNGDQIELDERIIGYRGGGAFADDGADTIFLRLPFEARGEVDGIAEHRIIEALLRSQIADDTDPGIEPDADAQRLERAILGFGFLFQLRIEI